MADDKETDYFVLSNQVGGPYCGLYDSTDDWSIRSPAIGRPTASEWPTPYFKMSDSVSGIVVPDFIDNSYRYLMLSERATDLFRKVMANDPVEYLPFRVRDHRDREVDGNYFVVNPLGAVDCADKGRTAGEEDPVNPPLYDYIDELHLDVARIPAGRRVFRLSIRPQVIVVHHSVKAEIEALKMVAARFLPMGGPVE